MIATVGLVHGHVPEEVFGVPRLRDDIESRVGQQSSDPLPQQDRVVSEHHADARSKHGDGIPQGREVARQVVGEKLVDALRPREPLQPMLSEVAALIPWRAPSISSETTICPPWPALAMRDARTASTPV